MLDRVPLTVTLLPVILSPTSLLLGPNVDEVSSGTRNSTPAVHIFDQAARREHLQDNIADPKQPSHVIDRGQCVSLTRNLTRMSLEVTVQWPPTLYGHLFSCLALT